MRYDRYRAPGRWTPDHAHRECPLITRAVPWSEQTGDMTIRLSIGDFSRMTCLSVKSLRRYHDMGLLEPANIDRDTGYRYYEASQVPLGQAIRRFRDLEMPLEQLKEVLHAPDASARNKLIIAHLEHMESALQQTQQTVASLRALLEQPHAPIAVEYRSVACDHGDRDIRAGTHGRPGDLVGRGLRRTPPGARFILGRANRV